MVGAVALCLLIVGTVAIGINLGYDDIDVAGAFLVPTVLCIVTTPFIRSIELRHGSGLTNIVTAALVAKMVGAYARYLVMNHVYSGNDSGRYHQVGSAAAQDFLDGGRSFWSLFPRNYGTPFIEELNGLVALLSGRSMMASYMVFSWFGFIGLWCFVGAFRRVLPESNLRRYAILTFFLPSALFWPSSLGKEAWMLFGLGLFVSGVSRVLTSQTRGLLFVVLGTLATAVVRPHVTALLLLGLIVASVFARGNRSSSLGPVLTMTTIALIAAGAAFTSGQIEQNLPGGSEGFSGALETATYRSTEGSEGGSEIEVTSPNSPLEYPRAFFTVMFRPLPFEVRSATQLFSALETTALLALIVVRRREVTNALKRILLVPYLRFAGIYTAAFAFAWSSVGNLGIISRQRVQVLPFLLVFLCFSERRGAPAHLSPSSTAAHRV